MISPTIAVLVRSAADLAATSVIEVLRDLVRRRLVRSFFDISVELPDSSQATFIGAQNLVTGIESCDVLDRLATFGTFGELRLVGLSAFGNAQGEVGEKRVDSEIRRFRSSLEQLLGSQLRVSDFRVGIRAFSEEIPTMPFFAIDTNCNLMVIPQDRKTDGGVARPILRGESEAGGHSFALHGATELASVLGLWEAMSTSPIDEFDPLVAGTQIPKIRFSQSRTRVLVGPPLPLSSIARVDEDLPLPVNFLPASSSQTALRGLASSIYPKSLVFSPDPIPDFNSEIKGGVGALFMFLGEMAKTFVSLPKVIVKGIRNELDSSAARIHQDLVGSNGWLRVVGATSDVGEAFKPDVDDIIRTISEVSNRELVSPLGLKDWSSLVNGFLGIVDGDPEQRSLRLEVFGNDHVLLVNRSLLGSANGTFDENVGKFVSEVPFDSGENSVEQKLDVESAQGSESVEIDDESVSKTSDERATNNVSPTLLERINFHFKQERAKAYSNITQSIGLLREAFQSLHKVAENNVSSAVATTGWIGFLSLIFLMCTTTPLRDSLDFFPSSFARDATWTGFSGIFIVAALLLLGIGGKRSWQIRTLITGGVVGTFVALTLVFFDEIRDAIGVDSKQPIVATILGLATAGLLIVAIRKCLTSETPGQREIGRLYTVAVSIYLTIGLIFQQVMDRSFLGRSESRTRVLIAGTIIASSVLIACVTVVAAVKFREKYRLRRNERAIEWLKSELEVSVDALRRLTAAQIQWAGTSSALLRLTSLPLGKIKSETVSNFSDLTSDDTILKFDVAELRLNEKGMAGLTARLRRHFVEPGWLKRQYEKIVRKFHEQTAFRIGSNVEDLLERRPESDPMVFTLDEVLGGSAGSDRWLFGKQLFSGDFDSILSEVPEELSFDEIYQSVLDDKDSYSLGGVQFGEHGARDFLTQVLPTQVAELPSNLVTRTFIGSDRARRMQTCVWWPTEVAGKVPVLHAGVTVNNSERVISKRFDDAVILVGVRVDLSEPFSIHECVGAQIESETPRDPKSASSDDF